MKDEIKEKIKAYYVANDVDKITDYITNLQDKVEWYENIEINKTIDKFRLEHNKEIKRLNKENEDYKSRNEKAIEYLEKYDVFKEFTFPLMKRDEENQVKSSIDYQFKKDLKKNLLNILQGVVKDEKEKE